MIPFILRGLNYGKGFNDIIVRDLMVQCRECTNQASKSKVGIIAIICLSLADIIQLTMEILLILTRLRN